MFDYAQLQQAVISGKSQVALTLSEQALSEGLSPVEILNQGLIAGLDVVGVKFKKGEYYLPQVLLSAKAMKTALELIEPLISKTGAKPIGTFVIGTVKGDLHDIGKNLVAMMFKGAGFNVIDLGIDVSAEKFITAIQEFKPDIVGMSALLTTTMAQIKNNIQAIDEAGLRDRVKLIVGGAPVSQRFADEVGADAYAVDAVTGVEIARQFLSESRLENTGTN